MLLLPAAVATHPTVKYNAPVMINRREIDGLEMTFSLFEVSFELFPYRPHRL